MRVRVMGRVRMRVGVRVRVRVRVRMVVRVRRDWVLVTSCFFSSRYRSVKMSPPLLCQSLQNRNPPV